MPEIQSLTKTRITGEIVRVRFANPDNGFTVAVFRGADGTKFPVVGTMPGISAAQFIEADGYFDEHREFGREFKVDSYRVIPPATKEGIARFLRHAISGIGPKTADHLKHYHLNTIRDLLNWSEASLQKLLGVSGLELYRAARGIDDRPVLHLGDGEAKSYGKEVTYQHDMTDIIEMESTLRLLARTLSIGLMEDGLWCHTVTLKIKYNNLQLHTRSKTLTNPIHDASQIYAAASQLLRKAPLIRPVRLLGISTSSFTTEPVHQITLEDTAKQEKKERLNQTLMQLYDRFGKNSIQTGGELESQKILKERGLD